MIFTVVKEIIVSETQCIVEYLGKKKKLLTAVGNKFNTPFTIRAMPRNPRLRF